MLCLCQDKTVVVLSFRGIIMMHWSERGDLTAPYFEWKW